MMTDDLHAPARLRQAVPVMKMEAFGFPRIAEVDRASELTVVIAGEGDQVAVRAEFREETLGGGARRAIVDQIADDHEMPRLIIREQGQKSLAHGLHPPHRHEATRCALADFITEMQIRDREPFFTLVEKREPAVEENFVGDTGLIWL